MSSSRKYLSFYRGATHHRRWTLRDSMCTEVRFLIAIAGQGPTPPEGGMSRHRSGVTQSTRESKTRLLIRRLLIYAHVLPSGEDAKMYN
ncbi:hypothetical protein AVEN_225859-1 [Araneus ventricosus]|uniref:Uncharacterized protein n=1 Tax=Araneus ventricosus TaxID=182803 RepID=A0A4Y2BBB6_ARAVE|nr:hypothetical protein AVEN_225859-1 [Araneus ventricosus]